jgi:hypothetical protein
LRRQQHLLAHTRNDNNDCSSRHHRTLGASSLSCGNHHRPLPSSSSLSTASTSTQLEAAGVDFTDAAKALFGNLISPAAMLMGALVPLSFLASPLPEDRPHRKKLKCIYSLLSVASVLSNLIAIMTATVARNMLTEIPSAPAASVFALIRRDCELPWLAANAHFLMGLLGFGGMVALRTYLLLPGPTLNAAAAGMSAAACLAMLSIVNAGVRAGDGRGHRFSHSLFGLLIRYGRLLGTFLVRGRAGPVAWLAALLATGSMVLALANVVQSETSPLKG